LTEKLLLRLSGEHPSLPGLEAQRLFSSIDPTSRLETLGERLAVVTTSLDAVKAERVCRRLALTREASRVVSYGAVKAELTPSLLEEVRERSFLVRARNLGPSGSHAERLLGDRILQQARQRGVNTAVSVSRPNVVILLSRAGGGQVLSVLLRKHKRSTYRRKAGGKPFRHPVGIDPVVARVMVNLAGVLSGASVFDPFCGTGSILVEAGIVGARIFGMDCDQSMIKGARQNLAKLQPRMALLVRGDALRSPAIFNRSFDHVVTDPPYGRSSPMMMDAGRLFSEFPSIAHDLLSRNGTVCFASPSTVDLSDVLSRAGLDLEAFVYQRVHGGLGRHLYAARKR